MFKRTKIIKLAFRLIRKFLIAKINIVELKEYTESLLKPIENVADVLSDKNPDNKAQLLEIWTKNKSEVIAGGIDTACLIISKEFNSEWTDIICTLIREAEAEKAELAA